MKFNSKCWVLVALFVAGCGGSGSTSNSGGMNNNTPPPAGTNGASFASFVKAQFAQTSDTTEPVDVNGQQLQFDENETAFDDVLNQ